MSKAQTYIWGSKPQLEGYNPVVRVWLQKITFSNDAQDFVTGTAGTLVELKDWTAINISRNLVGESQLTVTLPNPRDKFLRLRGDRSQFDFSDSEGGKLFQSHLDTIMDVFLPLTVFRNRERVKTDFVEMKKEYARGRWNSGVGPYASLEGAAFYRDLLSETGIGEMQRIFVDILGEDEQWYAGFSGLISGMSESYSVNDAPAITLTCKDMMRVFSMSELLTRKPIWSVLIPSALQGSQNDIDLFRSNSFSEKKISEIVLNVARTVQQTFCLPAALAFYPEVASSGTSNKVPPPTEVDFWFKHDFWDVPAEDAVGVFEGELPLRRVRRGDTVEYRPIDAETTLEDLKGFIHIDKYLGEAEQSAAYQLAVGQTFEVLQPGKTMGDTICRTAADLMWCDFYANGNGDIVLKMSKRNNFPGSIPVFPRLKQDSDSGVRVVLGQEPESTTLVPDGYDFSPEPDYMPVKAHGMNYVIADPSLMSWTFNRSEEPLVNFSVVPMGGEIEVSTNQVMNAIRFTGYAQDVQSQRRYGIRYTEASRIFNSTLLMDARFVKVRQQLMNMMAKLLMVMRSGMSETGTVVLKNRPDLDVGQNLMLFERQKLGYIESIALSHTKGGPLQTTLNLGFVHDISRAVPNPWIVIRELPSGASQ